MSIKTVSKELFEKFLLGVSPWIRSPALSQEKTLQLKKIFLQIMAFLAHGASWSDTLIKILFLGFTSSFSSHDYRVKTHSVKSHNMLNRHKTTFFAYSYKVFAPIPTALAFLPKIFYANFPVSISSVKFKNMWWCYVSFVWKRLYLNRFFSIKA